MQYVLLKIILSLYLPYQFLSDIKDAMVAKWQKTKSFVIPDDDGFNECLFKVAHPNSKI